MFYKSILIALLGLFLTSCAVYGGGYGHRGYDRHYYPAPYYRVERYPVYVTPRYYWRDGHRYEGRRYDGHSYDGRRYDDRRAPHYYAPAPTLRHYQIDRRDARHDDRGLRPQVGWGDRRERGEERQHQRWQDSRQRGHDQQGDDDRRGWERQRN
ncbi:hypothetical protein [Pseudomonas sp.]|uniref:hypothetical protein n=1 Tax=Pseudomonas sp. TaxID=306 RepID=UPI002734D964|nr:hypothetical protein [Pseudomonas sp.]MDP3814799.1 hypothetical protein [Pseudomonas sp.]